MEMFWRTKGKRIAAWLMIALIMATTIPFGSISASADDTTTDESDAVTITGQVMVPDDTNENTGTSKGKAYAGAKVIVKYPKDSATTVTHNAITGADGSFTIPIDDLTLKEDDKYTIEVEPADADKDTYDRYSDVKTVTADQVSTKAIELSEIMLKKKSASYSVTANANTSDNSAKNDAGEVKVENNVVTATPKVGYEVTAVTVKKEKEDWKPDGETDDNWWTNNKDENGVFKFEGLKDVALDANYTFTITFAKKQFTIIYKISQNGKLILNSGAQDDTDKVEIKAEQESIDGNQKVPYTNDAYKIKAAVTDSKYHLKSFMVDGSEILNTSEIDNALKEKEYVAINGKTGEVHNSPSKEEIKNLKNMAVEFENNKKELNKFLERDAVTLDNHNVEVVCNIGTTEDLDLVEEVNSKGIGLLRSEFLYMKTKNVPTEEQQFIAYKRVAETMKKNLSIIRTLDIGGDKDIKGIELKKEENPFLGYRAIRICLEDIPLFKAQLRAILRASMYGNLAIMLPMISSIEELRKAKQIIIKILKY